MGEKCHTGFVPNFVRFLAVQNFFLNRLRFDEVTDNLKVETFLRHGVVFECTRLFSAVMKVELQAGYTG